MTSTRLKANLLVLGAIAGSVLLYRFPPERYAFYPACPVFRYLHLYCPGCGSTRALAALLHGHFGQAMYYNPFFVMLLPLLLAFGGIAYWSAITRNRLEWPRVPQAAVTALLAVMAVFTVFRNF
jgi:hypothetical protein